MLPLRCRAGLIEKSYDGSSFFSLAPNDYVHCGTSGLVSVHLACEPHSLVRVTRRDRLPRLRREGQHCRASGKRVLLCLQVQSTSANLRRIVYPHRVHTLRPFGNWRSPLYCPGSGVSPVHSRQTGRIRTEFSLFQSSPCAARYLGGPAAAEKLS